MNNPPTAVGGILLFDTASTAGGTDDFMAPQLMMANPNCASTSFIALATQIDVKATATS